jgi:hypothetical protein
LVYEFEGAWWCTREIESAVVGGEEYLLAVIAAPGDMVGNARKDRTLPAGHNSKWRERDEILIKNASVPTAPLSKWFQDRIDS